MGNKYVKGSRLSAPQFRHLLRLFAVDLEATKIAHLSGLHVNTVDRYMLAMRMRLADECARAAPFKGVVEIDESYFGARRVRGKRGRGAGRKVPVIGVNKRGGMVFTDVLDDCSRLALEAVIKGKVSYESIIHTDGWKGYDGLIDIGYKRHFRVHHSHDEFARGPSHINGIESFWSYAKTRLAKHRGLSRRLFYLYIKETEFRFNHRQKDLYRTLLILLRKQPLKLH